MCENFPQEASTVVEELYFEYSKETGAFRTIAHSFRTYCLLHYPLVLIHQTETDSLLIIPPQKAISAAKPL